MPKKQPAKPEAPDLSHIVEDLRPLAVAIDKLKPNPKNPQTHDEQSIRGIMASLTEFGQCKPVVALADTGVVLAGNGTLEAAQRLGWTHLAAVRVAHDQATATGYAIADNRTAQLAAWNHELLQELLAEIDGDHYAGLADALLLKELRDQVKSEEAEAADDPVPETFEVIVTCKDEADQKAFYEAMQKENRQCRLLTL